MKNVGIYLTFEDGKCGEAFDFYKKVFGGEFGWKGTYGDSPLAKDTPVDQHDHIMHISLTIGGIGNKFALMGSDRSTVMTKEPSIVGTNTQISVTPDTKEEADRLFQELSSNGGTIEMPMDDQFWGSYFGACCDKFGTRWMIDYPSGTSEGVMMKSEMKLAAKALRDAADITTKQAILLEKLSKEEDEKDKEANEDDTAETKERHTKKIKIDENKEHRLKSEIA